jgi:ketosteroid isomerase-like protein
MSTNAADIEQIESILEDYRLGFATLDAGRLKAIWDSDYPQIIYVAQELAQPIHGWKGVERYYERVASSLERVFTMTIGDVSIEVFGDVAFAYCTFHFVGDVKGQAEPRIADGRNTFLFRHIAGGWRTIHYHESKPGTL